jgi:hypothetical protein
MGRTACTEPQCLYKGDLYLYLLLGDRCFHELPFILRITSIVEGRDSSIDLLRAGRSGDRFSVGAGFSTPVQTGPGATQPFVPGLSRDKAAGEWR